MNKPSPTRTVRLTFDALLIPTGAVLVLLTLPGTVGQLLTSLGLSLIVTGVAYTFRELVISRGEADEAAEKVATRVLAQVDHTAQKLAVCVRDQLRQEPLLATGIR